MNNNENNDQEYKGISQLPVARVQKIIKADKEMENCAKEAVFLISIATQYFIKYLTDTGYIEARLDKRSTIQYKDLCNAVEKCEELEFLKDIIPSPIAYNKALELQKQAQGQSQSSDKVDDEQDANQILYEPPHKNKKRTHAHAEKLALEQGTSTQSKSNDEPMQQD